MNNFYFSLKNKTKMRLHAPQSIRLLLVLLSFLFANFINAQTTVTISTTGSGTWTVPCGVTSITVQAWGAGGAGGGTTTNNSGGSGGGGGGYSSYTVAVSPEQIISYTVGSKGTGGTGTGGNGGATTILALSANGGGGGGANQGTAGALGTATGGTNTNGTSGGTGTTLAGAAGGSSNGLAGGSSRSTNGNGNAASNPGSGGGGAFKTSSSNRSGGDGSNGQIIITYAMPTYCTPSFNSGVEPITNVTFAGINNTTSAITSGASLEEFCTPSASVIQGSTTNAISVKGNTAGAYTDYFKVYVDWDQNGVFGNNSNEIYDIGTIYNSTGTDSKITSVNIAVPSSATLGTTKMRVVKIDGNPSNNPCFSGSYYGQAEDYIVTVTSPCSAFVISSISATTSCIAGNSTATITSTASGLPVGTYTVTYNTSLPAATGLTATMTVSTAGTGTFSATGFTTAGSNTIEITKLESGSCSTSFTGKTTSHTISANNTAGAASSSPTLCLTKPLTSITHSTTGATGIGAATGLPSGVTASWASNTITISGTPTAFGIFKYSIPLTGGCGSISATGTINVTDIPPTPTATVTAATCSTSSNGAISITGIDRTPLQFNNSERDYVSLGSNFLNNLASFTLEGWIKFNKADITGNRSLFGQNDAIEFYLTPTNLEFYSSSVGAVSTPLTDSLGNNAWHHVAVTGDGSNVKIYIDGTLMITQAGTTSNYGYSTTVYNASIGGGVIYGITTSLGEAFQGQIRKVGMYNAALSGAAISTLSTTPNTFYAGTEPGLLAGYNFTESSGTTLTSVPAGKNGTFGLPTQTPEWINSYSWSGPGGFSSSSKDISGLIPGTYTVTVSSIGSACTTVTPFVVGNSPANTSGTASSSPNICIGSAIATVTHTTTGATGIGAPTGLPTGVSASWSSNTLTLSGTPTVTGVFNYSIPLTGGCGSVNATGTITVNANASITSVSGASTLCINETSNFTANGLVLGGGTGTWSSSNTTAATVDASGVVTALAAGTTIIKYTITGGCTGTKSAQQTVIVNSNARVTSISGSVSSMCISATTTYIANSIILSGGTGLWSSSNTSVATVDSSGIVTGVAVGSADITYTITGGCGGTVSAQKTITINPNASIGSISGPNSICIADDVYYTANSVVSSGGTVGWSSSNTSVATVTGGGVVRGIAVGTATISYTITGGCGGTVTKSQVVTVNLNASIASVSGTSPICIGSTATYTANSVVLGGGTGTWSSDTPSVATVNATTGVVTGITQGTALITYTINGGCGGLKTASQSVIVNSTTVGGAVSGGTTICYGQNSATLQVSGQTGNIIKWQSSVSPFSTWSDIVHSNTTYTALGLTQTTRFRAVVQSGGCVVQNSNYTTVTVNNPIAPTGDANQSFCAINSPKVSNLVVTGTGVKWYLSATGGGALASTTVLSDGTHYYASQTISGCEGTNRIDVTVTVQTVSPPSLSTITPEKCNTLGSVVLTGLPASGTLYQAGQSSASYTITSTSMTISNLAVGSYTFTASNGSCTSLSSNTVTIDAMKTNTWTGTWDNGTTTTDQKIVFNTNHTTINTDINGCSCKVNSGVNVNIWSGKTMKIVNEVQVLGTGTLKFENGASLVQINDTPSPSNSGNITYNRSTTPILQTDYVYWSAPVSGFTLGGIVPGTLYYSYNVSANSWSGESGSTTMGAAVGYIVRGGGTWFDSGTTTVSAAFTGAPHNGLVNASSGGAGKTTLTGNPYASALNADAFIIANSAVLDGALYFWTHNTAIQLASGITNGSQGSGKYAYTSDDYATYTLTGGVGTGVGVASDSGSSNIPDGNIATGVAFFADGKGAGGTIIFNNSMRLGSGGSALSNSQMFKPGSSIKTAKTTTTNIEKNRVWLNLTNTQGAFKQTLIGYVSGATNNYDSGYDAVSYDGNTFIDFYSVNEDQPLTIQGRSLPFQEIDTVPLGYTTTISGEFTIGIQQTDGVFTTHEVFLEDKLTNSYTNLKETNYTFTTDTGTHNNRFTLSYLDKVTLGKDTFSAIGNGVVVFNKNKQISIQSSEELISKVQVFDVSGKLILDKTNINNLETTLTNLNSPDQVLILKIVLESGRTISTKIIY